MHELVWNRLRRSTPSPVLAQLPLDGGALLAAFAPGSSARTPLWLAKTAQGPSACRRLRAEADALRRLAPWALDLAIPQLLDFEQTGEGDDAGNASACLIQTALAGQPPRCRWGASAWADFPRPMQAALAWLQRFQTITSALALRPTTLPELGAAAILTATTAIRTCPPLAPLLAWVPQLLSSPAPQTPAIATHGDFWPGNLLWRPHPHPSGVAVIDWSGFGPGSALDDLLTWITQMPAGSPRQPRPRLELWTALWFHDGRARQTLRTWALRAGYNAPTARYAFYLFLARRLLWELGFGLQYRSSEEQQAALHAWPPLLAWLAQRAYPDPFTLSLPSGLLDSRA